MVKWCLVAKILALFLEQIGCFKVYKVTKNVHVYGEERRKDLKVEALQTGVEIECCTLVSFINIGYLKISRCNFVKYVQRADCKENTNI